MTKVNEEDIYLHLMEKYPQLTLNDIADMNDKQKAILLRGPSVITFNSYEDVLAYQQSRGK